MFSRQIQRATVYSWVRNPIEFLCSSLKAMDNGTGTEYRGVLLFCTEYLHPFVYIFDGQQRTVCHSDACTGRHTVGALQGTALGGLEREVVHEHIPVGTLSNLCVTILKQLWIRLGNGVVIGIGAEPEELIRIHVEDFLCMHPLVDILQIFHGIGQQRKLERHGVLIQIHIRRVEIQNVGIVTLLRKADVFGEEIVQKPTEDISQLFGGLDELLFQQRNLIQIQIVFCHVSHSEFQPIEIE